MFYGTHEYKVDSKGRVPIPAKFRRGIEGALILTQSPDGCITAYPQGEWERLAKSLESHSVIDRAKTRGLKRVLFGNAFPVDIDEQGRILLPPALRQHAGIGDTAAIVGTMNTFEIWDPAVYAKVRSELNEDAWTLIESLESKP